MQIRKCSECKNYDANFWNGHGRCLALKMYLAKDTDCPIDKNIEKLNAAIQSGNYIKDTETRSKSDC